MLSQGSQGKEAFLRLASLRGMSGISHPSPSTIPVTFWMCLFWVSHTHAQSQDTQGPGKAPAQLMRSLMISVHANLEP